MAENRPLEGHAVASTQRLPAVFRTAARTRALHHPNGGEQCERCTYPNRIRTSLSRRAQAPLGLLSMIGTPPGYCPQFVGVKARYFTCKVCGVLNWCPTIELHDPPSAYETDAPLSELEGHGWSRSADSSRVLRGTSSLHHRQCLVGLIGAVDWICTSCLRITNAAHICMCFDGLDGTQDVNRTHASTLRRRSAASPAAWIVGGPPRIRTVPFQVICPISAEYKTAPLPRAVDD
jgi:hypothetical protein